MVVTMMEFNEKKEGVVALHLSIEPLKTSSGLDPVPRCEPSTYQTVSRCHRHSDIGAGTLRYRFVHKIHDITCSTTL